MAEKVRESLLPYEWPGTYYFGDEETTEILKVLRSRSPYRFYGHDLQHCAERLEAAYCIRLNRKHALAVNSGTAALSVALGALGLGPGDEVLIPGYLWVACVATVVQSGAIPRLVDVDDTFCMDPVDLERKIGPRSRVVMLVHMSGAPGAVDQIARICREHKLYLIEDCAQANGASYFGKPVGSFGDIATFSFQLNKNITAGEGGLLACDDDRLFRRAWACHDLGYPRTAEGRLDTNDLEFCLWGQGRRCPELVAAVVLAQLPKLDLIVSSMRERKYALREKLSVIPGLSFRRILDPKGDSGAFLIMIWKDRETCLRMVERTRAGGIHPGPQGLSNIAMTDWGLHIYYNNLSLVHKQSITSSGRPWTDPLNDFAASYCYGKGTLPRLDGLIERSSLLCIPPVLSDSDVGNIAAAFIKASD